MKQRFFIVSSPLKFLMIMNILRIYPSSINERHIDQAVELLRQGGVIIYPTDTLYAIGCDALSNAAIRRVCDIKGIDARKESLSVVCADLSQASEYAKIDNAAYRFIKDYVPGPFTFILPVSPRLPKEFKGRREVGIRIPDNPIPRAIAEALGNPVLSTSITWDPEFPLEGSDAESIALRYAGRADLMINGGSGALEGSTIVDLTDSRSPEIIRQGLGQL